MRSSTRPSASSLTLVQLHGEEGPSFCAEVAQADRLQGHQGVPRQLAGRGQRRPRLPDRLPPLRRLPARRARRDRGELRLGARRRAPRRRPGDPRRRSQLRQRRRRDRRRESRGGSTSAAASSQSPGVKDHDLIDLVHGGREPRRRDRSGPSASAAGRSSRSAARSPTDGAARLSADRVTLRPLRGPLRSRGPDRRPRRADRGLGGGARRPRLPRGARRPPARLRRPADAALSRHAALRAGRPDRLPEARGPRPHRRPQDQQRGRPGAAREADGQAPDHRRDRRRPARGRDGDRLRPARARLRRLHGHRGHAPPAARTSSGWGCWERRSSRSRRAPGP